MKKIFALLCLAGLLASCAPKLQPLKGKYLEAPYQMTTNKPYDEVWSNVIDLFAQKGLAIGVIDKSSGIITSSTMDLRPMTTMEGLSGNISDKQAWVVVANRMYMERELMPERLTGSWNVRIKPVGTSQTSININLVNIDGETIIPATSYTQQHIIKYEPQSTGVFEQMIAEQIK